MTKREEVFYKNLIISDEDKIRAEKSLKSKGVEKHILIKKRLLNWSTSESIEYEKVASTYRYDKRIRYTLFKYISYLEELYRAVILDNYVVDVRQKFWIKDLREQLKAYSNNLNDALEHIDFSALLIQCQRLPKEVKALCGFPKIKHLKDDSIALKELRNHDTAIRIYYALPHLPNQTLLPTKALKSSSKRYIVETLLKGRTNLLELGEKYADRGFTETTYEYATKCLNMLLHDICNQNDSGVSTA